MIEHTAIEHHIQKHIISVLMHQKYARFRDMRPAKIDTNLYSYHLKLLQKRGFVRKATEGYTLDTKGLLFVDRVSTKSLNIRTQPKIITMLVLQNPDGDVLLYQRRRQPYTDQWTLPYGKLHIEDATILAAAQREAREKLAIEIPNLQHAGDCYIRITEAQQILMSTLVHVFYAEVTAAPTSNRTLWARPHKLGQYDLAPAVEQIVTRAFFRDPYFFEEYSEELVQ